MRLEAVNSSSRISTASGESQPLSARFARHAAPSKTAASIPPTFMYAKSAVMPSLEMLPFIQC